MLRTALGEEAILSDPEELRLNPRVVRADVAEFEGALEWLEQSDRERNRELRARALAVLKDPLFARFRHDPRLRDLLRRIGFPP